MKSGGSQIGGFLLVVEVAYVSNGATPSSQLSCTQRNYFDYKFHTVYTSEP